MATEAEFWGRPFEPGPVRIDPNADAIRVRVVREALAGVADDAFDRGASVVFSLFAQVAEGADDASLLKLRRMLKHG